MQTDPRSTAIQRAIHQHREIEFKLNGAPVTLRPHILYSDPNGELKVAGGMGDISVTHVRVLQISDLVVTARIFRPDRAFDSSNAQFEVPILSCDMAV
jgi:hypothetical protein